MNCLLTGGGGIVGSHIIFEWIHKAIVEKTVDHLFVIIRDNEKSAEQRLLDILQDASRPEFLNKFTLKDCLKKVTLISGNLAEINKDTLEAYDFDTIIHCAGSTSLLHTTDSKEMVHTQNYLITKHLLNELPETVTRFIYISTAYSFGIQHEKVNDTIKNYDVTDFRNPYEKSKYESELYVREMCELKKINSQILRPSIICGRLIDRPFYETPKFDVFYSWAMFLDKYANKAKENFRIWIDKKSGLNIVPVDFVSKAILYAFLNPDIKELNIVNPEQILHTEYVSDVLDAFKVNDYEYVEERPENLNAFEQLYYKTIGVIFEKYISVPDLQFKPELILKLIADLKLENTLGVHKNFMNLINFSVDKKFRKSY
ncbi:MULTISPECIES: SDR family oxidoreductase [unclassified Polaribacter]|uniref:SDR family oxidoreductase n=1 Tax=unclassified Polaribacter TaxID=196858 RepID=UPI0011BFC6AE|nr:MULTISPECIES: SDR family oxidoreductase [unclassified Polaribacter]TXD52508.1 NAD-dependent epimerase/dehydratase family protein [Polaribacter sp. IC063]TXD60494.1 NAD-dependent epimerase/dehydratase family protein [Polaribacter sp. IC066]